MVGMLTGIEEPVLLLAMLCRVVMLRWYFSAPTRHLSSGGRGYIAACLLEPDELCCLLYQLESRGLLGLQCSWTALSPAKRALGGVTPINLCSHSKCVLACDT